VISPIPGAVAAAGPDRTPERGSVRILIVDDSVDGAETLAELLQLWGYEARAVFDGEAGIMEAARFRPDVALLDIGLPGMDGYELARRLGGDREAGGPLLVALTGFGQEEDRRRSHEAGFALHLTKPVDLNELQRLLAACPRRSE
jgi:CheY-like chemotaxis protein